MTHSDARTLLVLPGASSPVELRDPLEAVRDRLERTRNSNVPQLFNTADGGEVHLIGDRLAWYELREVPIFAPSAYHA